MGKKVRKKKVRVSTANITKRGNVRLKKFFETNDPFVDYVLEDVWIRKQIGRGAVRARQKDSETLELIAMDEKALEGIITLLQQGSFRLKVSKLQRPTPQDYESWLMEQKDYPMLPGLYGEENEDYE